MNSLTREELQELEKQHKGNLREDLSDVVFPNGYIFISKTFQGCDFRRSDLKYARFSGSRFVGCNFRDANLQSVFMTDCRFDICSFSEANLKDADFRRSVMRRCSFVSARLGGSVFEDASLCTSNLEEADLTGANFRYADLRRTELGDTILYGATLTGTVLDPRITARNRGMYSPLNLPPIYAYRTKKSKYFGNTVYKVGETYTAPFMSWDHTASCHPGLYAYPVLNHLAHMYTGPYVKVEIKHGDFLEVNKGYRCSRFKVVEDIPG